MVGRGPSRSRLLISLPGATKTIRGLGGSVVASSPGWTYSAGVTSHGRIVDWSRAGTG